MNRFGLVTVLLLAARSAVPGMAPSGLTRKTRRFRHSRSPLTARPRISTNRSMA